MKMNLAVMFGSRTCEHDVSIISGIQALGAANPEAYNAFPVYIARDGAWYVGERLREISFYTHFDPAQVRRVLPVGEGGKLQLIAFPTEKRTLFGAGKQVLETADVVLPVMHGMNGEDGTLQGMLELLDVPYASTGVLGTAVGMDKIAMKQLFRGCGFPVLPGEWIGRADWKKDRAGCIAKIEAALEYPMFVKPANLGSSIGINRADDRAGLEHALDVAASFDRRILIERGVSKLKEINCAVLGYGADARASVPEMPTGEGVLDFDKKYMQGGKNSKGSNGMKSLSRIIPAPIGSEMTARVQALSLDIFRALDCKGVVRIDFILDESDGALYVNEANIIPGSLSFYLWEPVGVSFEKLIDRMVECALTAAAERRESVFSYDSEILKKTTVGAKGAKR